MYTRYTTRSTAPRGRSTGGYLEVPTYNLRGGTSLYYLGYIPVLERVLALLTPVLERVLALLTPVLEPECA